MGQKTLRHSGEGFLHPLGFRIHRAQRDRARNAAALHVLREKPLHPNKCELFEVLAICWNVGQVSRIHNHRDQNCWMVTPVGRLRVQNFRVEDRDAAHGNCKLVPTDAYDMDPTHPAVVQPEEPVHQVLNLPEFNQQATSVHIYSYPYASCEVYSIDKGAYSDVPLHYSSEYGKLSPDEKLL